MIASVNSVSVNLEGCVVWNSVAVYEDDVRIVFSVSVY